MKNKMFWIILLSCVAVLLVIQGCSCTKEKESGKVELSGGNPELNVEHSIALDRQFMFLNYSEDYRWFETNVVLKDFMDEECDGTILSIRNVFQYVIDYGKSADVYVVLSSHTLEGSSVERINDFWIEDWPLNEDAINIKFKEAFEKLMEANCPKPHSRQVTLRKMVGPVAANPQWIFGNMREQVYVDAVTGEVSVNNPSFPDAYVGLPLGEWP